jgi:hypothetical protein
MLKLSQAIVRMQAMQWQKPCRSHLMLMRLGAMRDRGGMPRNREALVDGLSLIPVPATLPRQLLLSTMAILQGIISKEA